MIEKYADYWNKANGGPYLDKVTFKILPEATTRVAGLQTGEVSMALGSDAVPPDQMPLVLAMEHVDLQLTDSYLTYFLAFNTQRPPFDNVKVRQALNYALDKVQLTQNLFPVTEAAVVARGGCDAASVDF